MNRLSAERRAQVIGCLVEGMSIRATVRLSGAPKNTGTKLLVNTGEAASGCMNETLRDLTCRRIECDEIWSFVHAKAKNVPEDRRGEWGISDMWTWVAIDAETKLVPTYLVGRRDADDGYRFMTDLAGRLKHRVQLTTDGHRPYLIAVDGAFGSDVDYAMLQKLYGTDPEAEKRYSPAKCIGAEVRVVQGDSDPDLISTSCVVRQKLTMRNGDAPHDSADQRVSKKVEKLAAAVSLHFLHYNFARPHKSLADPYSRTPAMVAGVADHVWTLSEIAALLD